MRYRWLVILLLISLVLGINALMPTVTSLISTALVWQVRWANDPDGLTAITSLTASPTRETPPQNMQALAQHIAAISGVEHGQHRPIEVIQIGAEDYLILIAGTRFEKRPFGDARGNNLESAIQQVTKQPSTYQHRVQALITQHIPPGSTLHFVGHSLGGMVANNLAITQGLLDHYTVKTVTTFGSPVNACPNPDVTYHRYVVDGDLVPLVHQAAIWSRIRGPLRVLESTCAEGAAYLEQTLIDHSPGPNGLENAHSSYDQSQDLLHEPLPFASDRYEWRGRFAAEPHTNAQSRPRQLSPE